MPPPLAWTEIDAYVERFERGRSSNPSLNPRDCLPPADHPLWLSVLRELACVEMELQANAGLQPSLADYHSRYPELCGHPDAMEALAHQELRLRVCHPLQQHPASAPRPTGWREQAIALFGDHRRSDEDVPPTVMVATDSRAGLQIEQPVDAPTIQDPLKPGGDWGGFRLLEMLGQGTFGMVFLAEQKGLANRPVALKIGEGLHHESQALARLQHSHIMPIHSVHRHGQLVGVCMPFLGRATLADVLAQMRQSGVPASGNALYSTLHGHSTHPNQESAQVERPTTTAQDPLATLRGLDHTHAVLWLLVRLADGLAHAHERGVLHRDLKPANVLLTPEGQPLLLDFNLADDLRLRGSKPAVLGGTVPYMAPEHLRAFEGGIGVVDERSDLYSLGVLAVELLTGQHPFPLYKLPLQELLPRMLADRLQGPPRIAGKVRASPALSAILRRCLEPDPGKRYASVRQLQEDAQRQLEDRPLCHIPEPSWSERLTKWKRRHPRLAWVGLTVLFAGLLLGLAVQYTVRSREAHRAEAVASARLARQDLREASVRLHQPFLSPSELEVGFSACRRGCDRLGLADQETPLLPWLPEAERPALLATAVELLLLSAQTLSLKAELDPPHKSQLLADALAFNAHASQLAGDSQQLVVLSQRARLLAGAGQHPEAEETRTRLKALLPNSGRDFYLLATQKMASGQLAEAHQLLRQASRRQPDSAAIWAALAACESASGRYDRAVSSYTTALALLPELWWVKVWRGQASMERGEFVAAEEDFTEVLDTRPGFAPALVLRAVARLRQKKHQSAQDDLTLALQQEPGNTRLYFLRAQARTLAGDGPGAGKDREQGLRRTPSDELSWVARGYARMNTDPKGALADFEEALKLNPFSREAVQNKAYVLSEKLGRSRDAIAALDRRLARFPDDALVRVGRGVLLARLGEREKAHKDARFALAEDTGAGIVYQVGCIYALTTATNADDQDEAFRLLRRAVVAGFGAEYVEVDPDLAPLRRLPRYAELVRLARSLRQSS